MYKILLNPNNEFLNPTIIVQLKNVKNKFIFGTDIGNIKVIEIERIMNDSKAGSLKPDKWAKNALGMLATLNKEVLYDCITEMQISFGPSKKITLEKLNEQLIKMKAYEKVIPEDGFNCQYTNISVLDLNSSGLLLINKTLSSIAIANLSNKKILASFEIECEYIIKGSFLTLKPDLIVVLTSSYELLFLQFHLDKFVVRRRMYDVVNFSLKNNNEKDQIFIFTTDNTLYFFEN